MNPVLEAIAGRRSIRGFAPEQISSEQRDALIDAASIPPARWTASPGTSPWRRTGRCSPHQRRRAAAVDEGPGRLRRLRFNREGYDVFYGARTVFFISLDRAAANIQWIDAGIAAENIALAAYSMGLGSVILGMPRDAFHSEDGDGFRAALSFPEHYDFAIAVAVAGVP
jgi:nitroreductase